MGVMQMDEHLFNQNATSVLTNVTWIDMQNYRDPPPYPGHSKQVFTNQPGFRQSFSGSETSTDVSLSSTENLATSQRQEPQGEETVHTSLYSHLDLGQDGNADYSILARLGMPPGALEAGKFSAGLQSSSGNVSSSSSSSYMYQHHHHPQQQQGLYSSGGVGSGGSGLSGTSPLTSQGHLTVPHWQGVSSGGRSGGYSHGGQFDSGKGGSSVSSGNVNFSSGITGVNSQHITRSSSSSLTSSAQTGYGGGTISSSFSSSLMSSSSSSSQQYLSPRVPPTSSYHHRHPYVNTTHWSMGGSGDETSTSMAYPTSLTPRPQDYNNSNSRNTTLDSSSSSSSSVVKSSDIRTCRSYEMMDKVDRGQQRSHPDLRLCASSPGIYMACHQGSQEGSEESEAAAKAGQMVELLTEENRALREELAMATVKVHKLHKLEMEIQKVHESHEALIKSSQKREALWQAMKRKLEEKIHSLEYGGSADGKQEHTGGSNQNLSASSASEKEFRIKLSEKDSMISKLLSQNQQLSSLKDQFEAENVQLNLSLSENRAHLDILENALLNAQSRVLALEEERSRKLSHADKVEQLQKALTSLQLASEKQEKTAQERRARLEKELAAYKSQDKNGGAVRTEPGKDDGKSVGMLRKMLDEKDARILQLETEIAGLEQKYVKEATLRQLHMEEKSEAPKEVRLAALEQSSSDMEKMIDEAKTEKLKHMEELHQSQRKVAELEAKVKQLQTQLVEKEAMVKVFQSSPLTLGRSTSLHALCHSPLHSPRPSLLAPTSSHSWQTSGASSGGPSSYREFATIRHMKTGSTSAIEMGRKMSMEEDLLSKVQSLGMKSESKTDSDEEVKLWHV